MKKSILVMLKNQKAFTFVELVIVLALVSLLTTIGMMSYSGYARDSRDVTRKTDLQNIQKTLAFFEIEHGLFPLPDNASTITHSGSAVWHQGVFGDQNFRAVKILSKKPVDPSHGIEYSYSLLDNRKEYELATIFEGGTFASVPGLSETYAAETLAYVTGTYNSRFSVQKNGSDIEVIALPNITSSREGSHSIDDIVNENLLVMTGKQNLPAAYNADEYEQSGLVEEGIDTPVIFSGNTQDLKDIEEKRAFIASLQDKYRDSILLNDEDAQGKVQSLLDIDTNKDIEVENFFQKMSDLQLGGFSY